MSAPFLNKRLNLVIPLVLNDGKQVFVHSTPVTRETFEAYFLVMGRALSSIYSNGLSVNFGPRFAAMMLQKAAEATGEWDSPGGVRDGLMMEIRRLSNIAIPTDKGWTTTPLQDAIDRRVLDADEVSEVEGQIVFFILVSAIHSKRDIPRILEAATGFWGSELTLLNSTEYARSLPISTATDSTGETAKASSIPS
jgi:hypothetical protein